MAQYLDFVSENDANYISEEKVFTDFVPDAKPVLRKVEEEEVAQPQEEATQPEATKKTKKK